ncbi:MAG TPA: ABC transporter substrate-binding protein [Methylomirabilota bacterium]|nr:ABC transporter substrate-binding protein [Methylomirabilota bacterium]
MSRGIAAMTRAVLFTPIFTISRPAKVVLEVRRTPPAELVQKAVEELLGDRATKARGDATPTAAEIIRVADSLFDMRDIAKRSLGRHWVARTAQERDEFTRLFVGMVGRAWLRTLRTGKRITYTGATVTAIRATVRATVALERHGQVLLEYQLVPSGSSKWQVQDLLVDKRSLVQSYREYFEKTLATTSYQDLIWKLRVRAVEATPAAEPA